MVAKWVFEYDNGGSWVAFAAKLQSTDESLNDHEEAQIALPNTSANRTLVGSSRTVRIKYDTHVVFTGQLAALDYGATRLKCILYNAVYEAMKAKTITADYTSGEQADTIFGAICTAAGVTAGTCPTTSIAVRFDEASCYDAALFLCDCLNLDHSATGNTFNIAARGSAKSVTHFKIKSRGVDRSKLRDKVRVKGVDSSGLEIVGEAGTGTNVAVFREKKASNEATLDALAAKKLSEINTDSRGAPVDIPIAEGYDLYPGDTLAITNALYDLSGTYRIMRISKAPTKVAVQLDRARSTLEEKLLDVKKYADLGIYTLQPSQITPWALSVQGLFALYHLNLVSDDEPDLVLDTSGSYPANDGTITSGYWVDGVIPGTKVLSFNVDGFVDCNNGFDPGGLDHFAVGLWFSPETSYADGNYLIKKADQFYLQHYSTDNKLRFAVKIGGTWHTVTSEAGVSPLWSRNFAMGIYDGTHLLLYLNGVLIAQEDQTGNVDASTNNTFLAVDFDGVISESMLWTRALTAQEVQELYFFPLTRSVKRTPIIEGAWLMQGTEEKTHNLVTEEYIVNSCILSGIIPVSSPTGTMNSYEAGYMCLALLHVGGYTALVEDVLDLMASLQNGDGSWYQQYNPYSPFDRVETISPGGVDGDLKVDSGAALMAWAMSEYDRLTSGTKYLSNVRAAMGFLRDLQYAHLVEYSSNLIANLVYLGTIDKVALLADCAECLLSMKAAMDAYGDTVQTTGSYSVKTMANDLYYSIAAVGWRGDSVHYYDTSFPYETNTGIPFNFKEKISYTQALCSWANKAFADSAYRTTSDYSSQCENCLDYINTLTRGSWGGQYFCPYYGGEGESKDEFTGYASLMSIACQTVNPTRYSALIAGTKSFLQWLALSDGRTYDCVSQRGRLWASKLEPFADIPIEGEFLVLGNSIAVLAGADEA